MIKYFNAHTIIINYCHIVNNRVIIIDLCLTDNTQCLILLRYILIVEKNINNIPILQNSILG